MKLKRVLLFVNVIVIVNSILFNGCRTKKEIDNEENHQTVKANVSVNIYPIKQQDAVITVTATGKTDAIHKEKLYSPIAGKIISLKVFEGNEVYKGDVVAVIQTKESNAAILGAESMIHSATTPEQRTEAEHVLQIARSTQNSVNVLAKFDGIVSNRSVSEGELILENGELMTVIDLSTIDFLADVSLHELSLVRQGQQAEINFQSMPQKKFFCVVDAINPQTDVQSQTVKVRLHFVNNVLSTLRTEIIGTASITVGIRHHALFVPKSALLRNDENNSFSIVLMTQDSLAKSIAVSVGTTTDSLVEIMNNEVRPGMMVITEGNYSLPDSTHVTVIRQE